MKNLDVGLNYWWEKYQGIKKLLEEYMRENNHKTIEDAIEELIRQSQWQEKMYE